MEYLAEITTLTCPRNPMDYRRIFEEVDDDDVRNQNDFVDHGRW